MKTFLHLWQYLDKFFLEWEMFQIKVVEKIKRHILCSITFFSENRAVYEIKSRNIVEPETPQTIRPMLVACWISKATREQAHGRSNAPTSIHTHAHSSPHPHAHSHTKICNIYFFSTAKMVSWTGVNITLYVHCLTLKSRIAWLVLKMC
jgi:hypothetical protein